MDTPRIKGTQKMDYDAEMQRRTLVFVVIAGNLLDIGRMIPVGRNHVIFGRDQSASLCINDDRISRQHLKVGDARRTNDQLEVYIEDLNSTNGTIHNGKALRQAGWCRLGETVQIGQTIMLLRLEDPDDDSDSSSSPLHLISRDSLTGVFNQRAFQQAMEKEHDRAKMLHQTYCIILIDVDFFKHINDTYGHPNGDIVLKRIANALQSLVRATDYVARVGGEEFAVLLTNQNVVGGLPLAERLRGCIESLVFPEITLDIKVTISLGLTDTTFAPDDPYTVYDLADCALMDAKRSGRNQCIVGHKPKTPDMIES